MSKKQTAVEWLLEQFNNQGFFYDLDIEAAKRLEREQIEGAFFKGHNDGYNAGVSCYDQVEFQSGDIYYTQTYGKCTPQS